MSVPTTPRAYDDCYEVYDQALKDPLGIRVRMKDYAGANHFRSRMHTARKVDRQQNTRIYEMDHPMFNASAYDCLYLTIEAEENGHYVYVRHRPEVQGIESLSGLAIENDEPGKEAVYEEPELPEPVDDLVDAEVINEPLQITSVRRI